MSKTDPEPSIESFFTPKIKRRPEFIQSGYDQAARDKASWRPAMAIKTYVYKTVDSDQQLEADVHYVATKSANDAPIGKI
jgi:hypothetical protein